MFKKDGTFQVFPTTLFTSKLPKPKARDLNLSLLQDLDGLEKMDRKGRVWSQKNYVGGYTSYSTVSDLHWRFSEFSRLEKWLTPNVLKYAQKLQWDLKQGTLQMTTCWISRMPKHTYHPLHIHPLSAISGTYYVKAKKGASALKIEDSRMPNLMSAPPRVSNPSVDQSYYLHLPPEEGRAYLFESWIRHEVPPNLSDEDRVSVSFNYEWIANPKN